MPADEERTEQFRDGSTVPIGKHAADPGPAAADGSGAPDAETTQARPAARPRRGTAAQRAATADKARTDAYRQISASDLGQDPDPYAAPEGAAGPAQTASRNRRTTPATTARGTAPVDGTTSRHVSQVDWTTYRVGSGALSAGTGENATVDAGSGPAAPDGVTQPGPAWEYSDAWADDEGWDQGDDDTRTTVALGDGLYDSSGPYDREPVSGFTPSFLPPAAVPAEPAEPDLPPLAADDVADEEPAGGSIAKRARGWRPHIGRRLRGVAGVDESLLARVPQERARYTALGGVVIGTSLIAMFSMWFAISEALGRTSWAIAFPAIIWGLFIFNFDRWLIASSMGLSWYRRAGTLVMRVLMAFLFGIIIAEPLVIRVFQTAIEQQIRDDRSAELAHERSKLVECNPEGAKVGAPVPFGCDGYVLTFAATPGSPSAQLAAKRADAAKLQAQITADQKQIDKLNNEARLECVGASGPGLTGHRGVGPNCLRLRSEADTYARVHPVGAEVAQLTTLNKQIAALETTVSGAQQTFEQQRTQMINQRVAELQSHQGSIGIMERLAALNKLAHTSNALFLGTWAVRLLFILVDCMPILVKFLGGITTYDRLVSRKLADAELDQEAELETAQDERAARVRRRRAEIDVELREHRAELGSRVSRAVHDLATEYTEPSARRIAPADRGTGRADRQLTK